MSLINGVPHSREDIDNFFTKSMEKLKASRDAEYQRQSNPPECPDTCEYKVELLEIPIEKLEEAEDITQKYRIMKKSDEWKMKHVLQDMRLKGNVYLTLKKELEILQNYLGELYGNSEKE